MKHLASSLLLLAACLSSSGARAASFDCGKARAADEKAICADPALGRLDEAVGQAYHALLGKLTSRFQARVQEAQRAWLKNRPFAADLAAAMRARLADLEGALVTVNAVPLLWIDGDRAPPYVLAALPGAAAYNDQVDDLWHTARDEATGVRDVAECERLSHALGADTPDPATRRKLRECASLRIDASSYKIDFVSPDLVSIKETSLETIWHGTRPPSEYIGHVNRWLSKPGCLCSDEMFTSPAYREVVLAAVRRFLAGVGAPGSSQTEATALSSDNWGFTADHLAITGKAYDYGMRRGAVNIEIPWGDFGSIVRPQFLQLLRHDAAPPAR